MQQQLGQQQEMQQGMMQQQQQQQQGMQQQHGQQQEMQQGMQQQQQGVPLQQPAPPVGSGKVSVTFVTFSTRNHQITPVTLEVTPELMRKLGNYRVPGLLLQGTALPPVPAWIIWNSELAGVFLLSIRVFTFAQFIAH
jgi:hypothetical protein